MKMRTSYFFTVIMFCANSHGAGVSQLTKTTNEVLAEVRCGDIYNPAVRPFDGYLFVKRDYAGTGVTVRAFIDEDGKVMFFNKPVPPDKAFSITNEATGEFQCVRTGKVRRVDEGALRSLLVDAAHALKKYGDAYYGGQND